MTVTQDAGPRIDPRFDARFQRGYDGSLAEASVPPTSPPQEEATANDAPVVDDAASAVDRPIADFGEDAAATTGETSSPAAQAPTPEVAAAQAPAESHEPIRFGAAARLWIALAASVGFVAVGAGVLWAIVSDPGFFMGRVGSVEEQAVMRFVMDLAPGFVQAGMVGVIVVLVVWAVRARRADSSETDPR